MQDIWTILIAFGVPSSVLGFAVWYLKGKIAKHQKKQAEQDKNLENLVLIILQTTRANTILCKATAEAVRDGHCNGNMTEAMSIVDKAAAAEREFLLEKGIQYIFE